MRMGRTDRASAKLSEKLRLQPTLVGLLLVISRDLLSIFLIAERIGCAVPHWSAFHLPLTPSAPSVYHTFVTHPCGRFITTTAPVLRFRHQPYSSPLLP